MTTTYTSRIPSDPAYTQLLGHAFYNFTYLEWVITWTIVRLSNNGFDAIPKKVTAGRLASLLLSAISASSPPLTSALRLELEDIHVLFEAAVKTRNELLHAHPYTAHEGTQQLGYSGGVQWDTSAVEKAALQFEAAAIRGSEVFHGALAQARS